MSGSSALGCADVLEQGSQFGLSCMEPGDELSRHLRVGECTNELGFEAFAKCFREVPARSLFPQQQLLAASAQCAAIASGLAFEEVFRGGCHGAPMGDVEKEVPAEFTGQERATQPPMKGAPRQLVARHGWRLACAPRGRRAGHVHFIFCRQP